MNIKSVLAKNGPGFLLGIGAASIWTAIGLTVKAANKARDILDEERAKSISYDEEGNEYYIEPTFGEKVKLTWKCFIPPVAVGIAGTSAIIGGGIQGAKRSAALATAAAVATETLKDQTEAIKEVVDEKTADDIENRVIKKKMSRAQMPDVVVTEPQNVLCFDHYLGRYFYSSMDALDKLESWVNVHRMTDNYVNLNEVFDQIAAPYIPAANSMVWTCDMDPIKFSYESDIAPNGQPVLVLKYDIPEKNSSWGY